MTTLAQALALCKPALAKKPFIKHYMHFLCTANTVVACDDRLGILVDVEHPLNACVPGVEFLNAITDDSTFKQTTGHVIVTHGFSTVKLPTMNAADYPLMWPQIAPGTPALRVDAQFIGAVEICMKGAGKDEDRPEFLGITVIPQGHKIIIASTDNLTITSVSVNAPPVMGDVAQPAPFVMPDPFCRALISAAKNYEGTTMIHVTDTKVFATVGDSVELFCSSFSVAVPWDYQGMLKTLLLEIEGLAPGGIGAGWDKNMAQAIQLLGSESHKGAVLRPTPTGFAMLAQRESYSADIGILFDGSKPRNGMRFDPKLLARVPKECTMVTFGERMAFFTDSGNAPKVTYIVSTSAGVAS